MLASHAAGPGAGDAAAAAVATAVRERVALTVEPVPAAGVPGLEVLDVLGVVCMAVLQQTMSDHPARSSLSLSAVQQMQRRLKQLQQQQPVSGMEQQQQQQQGLPAGQIQASAADGAPVEAPG